MLSSPKPSISSSWPKFAAWPLKASSSPAWVVAICRLLGNTCQVAPGRPQAAVEAGLIGDPLRRPWSWQNQLPASNRARGPAGTASKEHTPKRQTGQAPEPCKRESCFIVSVPAQQFLHCSRRPILTTDQPKGQSLPLTCKQQPRLNHNRRAHTCLLYTSPSPRDS